MLYNEAGIAASRSILAMAVRGTFKFTDNPSAIVVAVPTITAGSQGGTANVFIAITFLTELLNQAPGDAVKMLQDTLTSAISSGSFQTEVQAMAFARGDVPLTTANFPTVPVFSSGFKIAYVQTQRPSSRPSAVPSSMPTFIKRSTLHDSTVLTVVVSFFVSFFVILLGALLYAYFFSQYPTFVFTECFRKRVHDEMTRLKQLLPAPHSPPSPPPSPPRELDPGPYAQFLGLQHASPSANKHKNLVLLSERRRLHALKSKRAIWPLPELDIPMVSLQSQAAEKACL